MHSEKRCSNVFGHFPLSPVYKNRCYSLSLLVSLIIIWFALCQEPEYLSQVKNSIRKKKQSGLYNVTVFLNKTSPRTALWPWKLLWKRGTKIKTLSWVCLLSRSCWASISPIASCEAVTLASVCSPRAEASPDLQYAGIKDSLCVCVCV